MKILDYPDGTLAFHHGFRELAGYCPWAADGNVFEGRRVMSAGVIESIEDNLISTKSDILFCS